MNKHPSSAGLRQLADFLDNCAEEGIETAKPYICFWSHQIANDDPKVMRDSCIGLSKRLGLPIKMPTTNHESADVNFTVEFGGITTSFDYRAKYVCEQVTEMREVKVWKCGGVEVGK